MAGALAGHRPWPLLVAGVCSMWAATAVAQSGLPPESAPVVPANSDPPPPREVPEAAPAAVPPAPAPPPAVAPQTGSVAAEAPAPAPPPIDEPHRPPDWAARLNQVEQLARIAARKQELQEEQEAARKEASRGADTTVRASADDKGFSLQSGDGDYSIRIRALVQADGRFFLNDDALKANDTFLLRRFRPSLQGTLFSLVDYNLLPEFAGSAVQILDAYADVRPWSWLRLRFGKYKAPIGLERLQADADLPLLERALDSNLSSTRDVGVQLWGDVAGGIAQYSVAVLNGAVDGTSPDTDINHAKDLAARIFFQPFRAEPLRELGSLGVGLAVEVGNRKGRLPSSTAAAVTGLPVLRTAGQNTFFQYYAPANDTSGATTTFTHELATHINPQLYYYFDNLGLLAEYVQLRQGVQRGNVTTTLVHHAAHATFSYAFNGREGFEGVTPVATFDRARGAIGAFEIAVRWAWLKLDPATFGDPVSTAYADPSRSASSARAWTGGLTWIPRRSFRLGVNYERTTFVGGAGTTTAVTDRKAESVVIGRAQINF